VVAVVLVLGVRVVVWGLGVAFSVSEEAEGVPVYVGGPVVVTVGEGARRDDGMTEKGWFSQGRSGLSVGK
jgi:hypothetical protein